MNKVTIKSAPKDGVRISRYIYGHFAEHLGRCIYEGLWVGNNSALAAKIPNTRGIRNDAVAALRKIRIPILRWPGGCFADEYHWEDGIGSPDTRPKMVNTHWGGVTEDNSFGTHEFLDLCAQLSVDSSQRCEPYICGNVGSGTVRELSQWVEYCNFDGVSPMSTLRRQNGRDAPWNVRFWGIGNENWACGGNMSPEFYADNYRRYATYARSYGVPLYKIACGPSEDNYDWTRVLMEKAGAQMDALSLHRYTIPGDWANKGSATDFSEAEWYETLKKALFMDELLTKHSAIMDKYDGAQRVGIAVDEWGSWYDVEEGSNPGFLYQQNTIRDALIAALHLNIFNNHAERVSMANIAQMVNVLQSLLLTREEKMILTPTYHIFDMYQAHQGALLLPHTIETDDVAGIPALSVSASQGERIHITLVNIDARNEKEVRLDTEFNCGNIKGSVLRAASIRAHNTFDAPSAVRPEDFTAFKIEGGRLTLVMPPASCVLLELPTSGF